MWRVLRCVLDTFMTTYKHGNSPRGFLKVFYFVWCHMNYRLLILQTFTIKKNESNVRVEFKIFAACFDNKLISLSTREDKLTILFPLISLC